METIAKLSTNLLDENHVIYRMLSDCPPLWWNKVKNDTDLYVEIRKNNIIDIYYRGGRLTEMKFDNRSKKLLITAHPKYLGHVDYSDTRYYKKRIKDGKTVFDPIYSDCESWMNDGLDELKSNITKYYSGNEDGQDTSEKLIQGELIIGNRNLYIDSEFAHRFYEGKRKTIRIDLVKIENGVIVFEELKRIVDSRLRTSKGDPEIRTQIGNYRLFLKENQKELLSYYKKLYNIKKRLGLPIPNVSSVDNLSLSIEPSLIIANNYDVSSKGKEIRIKAIIAYLKTNNIVHRFL